MPYYLGIDIGSLSCDAVVIDESGALVSWSVVPTGARNSVAIERARTQALADAGISAEEVGGVVATGYGRNRVEDRLAAVTEITCHARGIRALIPDAGVLIDIGGQDSKAIRIDPAGNVADFAMNDKCAAGTGRFFEAMARAMEVDLDDFDALDRAARKDVSLSSVCAVFAESEVVSLIADGVETADIVRGLHRSVASRISPLVKRVTPSLAGVVVAMSGGVARNPAAVRALEEVLDVDIRVPDEPDTVGALGAALIARARS